MWLGKLTGLPFDLPTEAQWEFAASNRINSYRQPFPTKTGQIVPGKSHPTFEQKKEMLGRHGAMYTGGQHEPSPLGLHDLVGNGFEWMNDWYAADAYQHGPRKNPTGAASGKEKVLRGKSPEEDFSPFPHLMRYHKDPAKHQSKDDKALFPYIWDGFRCVVNRPDSIK